MVHISEREEQLPNQAIEKLLEVMVEDKKVFSLGPGEPDFDLPKPLIAEIKRLAGKVNHYSPPGGLHALREAICKKLRKENRIHAEPENVIVTCGSQEALILATAASLDASEKVLIPNPGYMGFLPSFELMDASVGSYVVKEEDGFEPDVDVIKKAIDNKTKVLLLNTPANPTGNVISKKVLEEIADLAIEHDLAVFCDEAYEQITYDGAKHVSLASLNGMSDRVFTFQTFSKSFAMCGFRVGFVCAPTPSAKAMKKLHVNTTICAPTISQLLALKALSLPKKYTTDMVKEYDKRRKVMVKRLNGMGLHTPTPKGAFYTFSNIKHLSNNSMKFAMDLLKQEHVAVVPGSDFGSEGEGYIRCSFATKLPKIEKALDRLEKFVQRKE